MKLHSFSVALSLSLWIGAPALAAEIRVAPGDDVQDAVDQAMPGDVVILEAGTHEGPVRTTRDGSPDSPIVLRGEGEAILTSPERVLDVQHAHLHVEDVVLDAQFAEDRVLRVGDDGDGFRLVGSVVRNARRHCIDIRNTRDIAIEGSLVHHCLAWDGGRSDAHGISAQSVQGLTIRDTEVHTFTGDAFQIDPSRSEPGWSDVLIEGCVFWLAPMTDGAGGVPDGVVPGENAIDTKTLDDTTENLVVRDTIAYGFRNGEINNMAAFNIKENVDAVFDRVVVYESEIAFRLRGASGSTPGAAASLTNVLIYDVERALRIESDIEVVPVRHVTFGAGIDEYVDFADGADASDLDVQNVVVLGEVPAALTGPGAVGADVADFADAGAHDYLPHADAAWIDSGADLGVGSDLRGAPRPQGAAPDPGAFEYGAAPAEDMGTSADDAGATRDDGGVPATPGPDADAGDRPAEGDGGESANADGGPDGGATADGGRDGCGCSSAAVPSSALPFGVLILLTFGRHRRRRWKR